MKRGEKKYKLNKPVFLISFFKTKEEKFHQKVDGVEEDRRRAEDCGGLAHSADGSRRYSHVSGLSCTIQSAIGSTTSTTLAGSLVLQLFLLRPRRARLFFGAGACSPSAGAAAGSSSSAVERAGAGGGEKAA